MYIPVSINLWVNTFPLAGFFFCLVLNFRTRVLTPPLPTVKLLGANPTSKEQTPTLEENPKNHKWKKNKITSAPQPSGWGRACKTTIIWTFFDHAFFKVKTPYRHMEPNSRRGNNLAASLGRVPLKIRDGDAQFWFSLSPNTQHRGTLVPTAK